MKDEDSLNSEIDNIKNEIDKCNCGVFKLSNKYKLKTRSSKGKDTFWGHILKHRAL